MKNEIVEERMRVAPRTEEEAVCKMEGSHPLGDIEVERLITPQAFPTDPEKTGSNAGDRQENRKRNR